jgi:putative hydrolase of HD superfamily
MNPPDNERLQKQIEFLLEIDKAKQIFRKTRLLDGTRYENDAEHSWHLAVMALVLAEHAKEPVNLCRVVQMALVHDIVEIDAGDTFAYDEQGRQTQYERELLAAERIFNLLPPDQASEFRGLWDEFEAQQTPEAKFAAAIDRLAGMLPNYHNQGGGWRENQVPVKKVWVRNQVIENGSPALWEYARRLIESAVEQGFFEHDPDIAKRLR